MTSDEFIVLAWVFKDNVKLPWGRWANTEPKEFGDIYRVSPSKARYAVVTDWKRQVRIIDLHGSALHVGNIITSPVFPKFVPGEFRNQDHAMAYIRIAYDDPGHT